MTRIIKPPYQLIEFSGGGLNLGGYAQIAGYLPPVTLLTSIGGLQLGGRTSDLPPVGDLGGLRLGGRARSPILVGQYSPALARFGSTTGMTAVVNSPNSQGSQYLPDIGFSFPLYGSTYRSNIAISSNWALLFGFNALASTDISRTVPGQAFLMAASRARSWDRVLVKADNSYSYRIRFETQISFGSSPVYNTFEVTLYSDGSIQLVCGTNFDFYGFSGALRVRSLTKGDNVSYADFDIPSGYYNNYPDTDSVNAGVAASFVFTPDDTAANSHTVRVGSYPVLAPKISRGGLLLGGYAVAIPPVSATIASIGGLRLGGRKFAQPVTGTYSPTVALMGGRSGMTQVVSSYADDLSQYLPDIGFPFPLYGAYYQSNISVCSNSYLLFGALLTDTYFSHNYPGRGLFVGARDGSWQNIYVKADSANAYRIRFEGYHSFIGSGATFIFEVTLFSDGAIQLVLGNGYDLNAYPSDSFRSLSKGDGISYADYPYTGGAVALSGFTDDSVLTSFVFTPDEVTRTFHTVQTGSYSRNGVPPAPLPSTARGGLRLGGIAKVVIVTSLSASISQPQSLIGGLSVARSLVSSISQTQSLNGSLSIGNLLTGLASQPQVLAGGLIVGASLSVNISQSQSLIGGLSVAALLASNINQPQPLSGSLSNAPPGLSSAIVQSQTLTGGLSVAIPLASNIIQTQTLTGGLSVGKLLTGSVSQPQVLAGGLIVAAPLASNIIQSQALSGSLAVSKLLTGLVSQTQVLAGSLSVAIPLQTETTSWISRVQGLGGQPTTAGTAAVDAFFVAIKSSTYWSKLKLLHLFAGTTTIASAMAPLKHPSNTAAALTGFSGSNYNSSGSGAGIQGNSSGYINHNFSLYGNLSGSSAAIGSYSKTSGAYGSVDDFGCNVSVSALFVVSLNWSDGNTYAVAGELPNGGISITSPGAVGFSVLSKTSASDARYYLNGTQYGIATATTSALSSSLNAFYSFASGAGFNVSPRKLAFSFASDGLTPAEVSSFSAAVSNLIGAV